MASLDAIPAYGWVCLGLGAIIALAILKWIHDVINAKREAKISEIRLDLKAIVDDNSNKSVDELVQRANERNRSGDPSDTP